MWRDRILNGNMLGEGWENINQGAEAKQAFRYESNRES